MRLSQHYDGTNCDRNVPETVTLLVGHPYYGG